MKHMCTANFSKEKSNKQEIIFSKVSEREKMSKVFNEYISTLDYAEKTFLVVLDASNGASIYSFTTVFGAPVAMASVASIKKKSVNNMKERKKKENLFYWSGINLLAQKKLISKALTDADTIRKEFKLMRNESQTEIKLSQTERKHQN